MDLQAAVLIEPVNLIRWPLCYLSGDQICYELYDQYEKPNKG